MKKNELKQVLKPLIKECIKECIFEEGVLSGIITEVVSGLENQRIVTEGVTIKTKNEEVERQERIKILEEKAEADRQERIKKLNESAKVGGVNVFEGIDESSLPVEKTGNGPLSGQSPGDPGVNIDGIVNLANGKWKHLI